MKDLFQSSVDCSLGQNLWQRLVLFEKGLAQ